MKKKTQDKRNYLVATEASIFPGGDEQIPDDFSDDFFDDDLIEFEDATDNPSKDASLFDDVPAEEVDEEPEALTGKKAAFFNTVTSPSKNKKTTDWLRYDETDLSPKKADEFVSDASGFDDNDEEFGEIEIDDEILMEGDFVDESAVSSPIDDDDDDDDVLAKVSEPPKSESVKAPEITPPQAIEATVDELDDFDLEEEPEVLSGRKAALFHSVEAPKSEGQKISAALNRGEPVVKKPEKKVSPAPKPTLAPLKPLEEAPVVTNTNKVAAEYGNDSSVFGAVGGQINPTKRAAKIIKTMRYLNQEAIAGLDLWEDGATACFLKWSRDRLLITHAGHIEFKEGSSDIEKAVLLRGFWKNIKMPTRSIWVNVHNASLLQKYVKYDIPIDELEPALRRDAEESMPGAVGNVAIDWVIKERFGGGGEGLLFALPVWEQEHLVSLLKRAGLFVCGMSVAACDIARLLMLTRPDGSGKGCAECVCSLSRTGADIVIAYGNGSIYSRTVYSRAGGWEKNLSYLYECLNDAVNHFNSWINRNPIATVLICGQVPEVDDLGGEMLRETGLLAEIWNPMAVGDMFELVGTAKRSGVLGRNLAGCLGLAMQRG